MTFQKAKLIVGLGNPGSKYQKTRHNIGRRIVEVLSSAGTHPLGAKFLVTEDFMNTSGLEVARFMAKKGIQPQEALIVLDDFEIPMGRMRIRLSGSGGTHNGLKSVVEHAQTPDIPRLRIGIGPVPTGMDPAHFVLEKFNRAEEKQLETIVEEAVKAVEKCISEGIEPAMNQYNGRTL